MQKIQRILFRCYFGLMLVILAWSILGYAQGTNQVTATVESGGAIQSVTTVVKAAAPTLTFGLDRVAELQGRFLDVPFWQYLASAIYVLLAITLARLFRWVVTVQLRKLAARTKSTLDETLIDVLGGPASVLALVILLQLGLNLYQWPSWIERWLKKGFYILLACSLTYGLLKVVDLLVTYWSKHPTIQLDRSFTNLLLPLISKSIKAFVVIMAVLLTLDHLEFNIRTLLAGVSISGLAIGLAAQDTVGNLFGAAAVFIDKPFKIGDRIQASGVDGVVEEMGLRSTRVRNGDGHLITVPNKTMGNATITNFSRRPNIKTGMDIGISYDTPSEKVEQAIAILREVYGSHKMTHDLLLGFNKFAENSLNIMMVHWWRGLDFKEYLKGFEKMNLEVKQRFDQAGISFAFPSRTVYLRQDNDWRVQLPGRQEDAA